MVSLHRKNVQLQMSSNKLIAKNTIFLYIRALISMLIGLYTSRVVIDVLGVDDYGVYGVAGGIVGMLGFLNASMAGATSRFITIELGKNDPQKTKITFANALSIHIIISAIVFIICESFGVWFLNCKLNIPDQSIYAANWVFQLSILSTIVSITQVPYTALVMSHERMNIYAYLEMANVSLKLLIVFLLVILPGNKLIIYALCMTLVSIGIAMSYRFYCLRNFAESKTFLRYNREVVKSMLTFSLWDLYGNTCVTIRTQGTTFILNIFFGVAINGAASIAAVLNGVLIGLSYNIITAFRPQIIKSYAKRSWRRFQELIGDGALFSSLILAVMAIPLVLETPFIFKLWLGEVPDYVVIFSRISIFTAIVAQTTSVITIGIHASGQIKMISFITGSIYLISLLAIYIMLKFITQPSVAFIIAFLTNCLAFASNVIILHKNVPEFKPRIFISTIIRLPLVLILPCICGYYIHIHIENGFGRLALVAITCLITTCTMTYLIALTKSQKDSLRMSLSKLLLKNDTK